MKFSLKYDRHTTRTSHSSCWDEGPSFLLIWGRETRDLDYTWGYIGFRLCEGAR